MNRCAWVSVAWLLLGAGVGSAGAQGRVEDSAKDAVYPCPKPAGEAMLQEAAKLYPAKYDKNKFGCAADLFFEAAQAAPADVALNVQALLVTTEYIDSVNTLWDFDLYGIRQPEWTARLEHAVAHGRALAERVAAAAAHDPSALAARALFQLSAGAKTADAKTQIAGSREAMSLLKEATAADPALLGGSALLALARLYYELPEFLGGDVAEAQKLLEQGLKVAPKNPSLVRYAAFVRAQEHDAPAAKALLASMPDLQAGPEDLQTLADELRNARDLATRLGDEPLRRRLDQRRDALLKQHPELLTRASTAANMHGGVDPITGKPY